MKDDLFLRGQKIPMTKEPVRALALSRLDLSKARLLIDVGAGTGSIAIEAALNHPELEIIAIEKKPEALALIKENCRHFNCPQIRVIDAYAPVELTEKADAIFVGGTGGNLTDIIDWALDHLRGDGSLVMTFILQDNLTQAIAHLKQCAVSELDCCELQAGNMTALGHSYYFKPNNPTYLISCRKEACCG
ncbi:decarboxylating cobalt-precorrin-6B (C(15))-methyltransferase [Klebsiella sp. BIGb0407]|uniref:decarboxylating cobalt-precorrin-6B (C(15))-methyltransferase n=1 Tax=Klebsiella sp. BIGb0407 TaxID=2940603 RepID=UPI0021693BCD|nr:decarboxylating cobalt-precorrin-6B (C(15))-methyltransferase [Klebsiella sp. BIGb0407]MCS3433974.1 cobalt-precorrin-6B (C15)-methyltransferase [Klebsiella sp. BIGb0407]